MFSNTENNEFTNGDDDTEVTITKEGNFTEAELDVLEEVNIFEGKENRITFQQVYSKTFKCEYELQLYPFDTQRCTMDLELRELERSSIRLLPKDVMMESETVLTQYIISKWSIQYKSESDMTEGIILTLILKRRIMNELLTTYLPTVFILCIVYATNYFKPFFFEAVVTVNLTSQLVLTTLFISVSNSLPPTAYVKMIDIWLIFCLLIPCVELLLHTFMDNMRQEGDREINHHGVVRTVQENKERKVLRDNLVTPVIDEAVPTYHNMTQRDEKSLVEARKAFYDNAITRDTLLNIGENAGNSRFQEIKE